MKKTIAVIIILLVIAGALLAWQMQYKEITVIPDENPAPKDDGNIAKNADLIRITSPRPNDVIKSPLTVKGEARGNWYFEASFPITLTDSDGKIMTEWYAMADGEWMTENFVPFTGTITFDNPEEKKSGFLIFKKDNPSGLPEYDNSVRIPVRF